MPYYKKMCCLSSGRSILFMVYVLYIASTVFVIYLSFPDKPDATTWNSLFWIIQLFICVNAVAKSFLQESKGRMLYFYSIVSPAAFIISKIIYNVLLMVLMSSISLLLFFFFLSNPVNNALQFTGIVILGGVSISLSFYFNERYCSKSTAERCFDRHHGLPDHTTSINAIDEIEQGCFCRSIPIGRCTAIKRFDNRAGCIGYRNGNCSFSLPLEGLTK
jgi:heme exporter protein B